MLNLIRSDLYKAFHMKSFYVCGIVPFLISALELSFSAEHSIFLIQDQIGQAGGVSLSVMVSIFMSLFVTAEYKNGYIKNIAGNLFDRSMLLISKLAVSVVAILIYFFAQLTVNIVIYDIFYEVTYDSTTFTNCLGQAGMLLFLNFALSTVITFFCIAARNSGASITMAFLIGSTFLAQSIIMTFQILQVYKVISEDFDISKYLVTSYIQCFAYGYSSDELGMALATGGIYMAASIILTILHIKKKDI